MSPLKVSQYRDEFPFFGGGGNFIAETRKLELLKSDVVVVVVLLFYIHGIHLRSCRDGQLT